MPTYSSYSPLGAAIDVDTELTLGVGSTLTLSIPDLNYTVVQGAWERQDPTIVIPSASATVDDEITFDVYLQAGTYTIGLKYVTKTYCGIAHISVDGVEKGTIDEYNAVQNVYETGMIAGVVISTTGKHTISIKTHSKNAASTDYVIYLSLISFMRTA